MKICIIGAGAMGGVHGGLLARIGHEVTLVDAWADHVQAINRHGLEVRGIRGDHVVPVRASTEARGVGPVDAAIVFTDSNATADAARVAQQVLRPAGYALTLQNGIGNIEALTAVLGADRVAAGVSMNSAACTGPGVVAYTNAGLTALGELDGRRSERILDLAAALNAAGIATEVVADPLAHVWSKFVLNCGINVLTAVTQLRSGEMFRVPEMNALQERVIDEILAVVERKGVRLADPDPRRTIREHCRVRFNKPSMLQHIEQGRRTEIDAINGALVREARALGVPVPCNETLVAVVKGLERSRRQALHEAPADYAGMEAQAEAEVRAEATGDT
jgi:2-dehydropantoate 2-reductase